MSAILPSSPVDPPQTEGGTEKMDFHPSQAEGQHYVPRQIHQLRQQAAPVTQNQVDKGQQNQVRKRKRVFSFFEKMATETKASRNKLNLDLARKKNALAKLRQNGRKQKERIKKMAGDLETTNAQIEVTKKEIQNLQQMIDEGTDDESDE